MQAVTKCYRLRASWTKVIFMKSQILNSNIPKKQLSVYPKKITSISDSSGWCTTGTVHTTEYWTWNTTNSKIILVLKDFKGVWWIQLYSYYQRFITTDGFEVDQTFFTNISSESNFQPQKIVKCCPIYTKNKFSKH